MKKLRRESKVKFKRKKEMGITLIALIITITILLILTGVSIALLSGDNGILTKVNEAKTETEQTTAKEVVELLIASYKSKYYQESNSVPLKEYIINKISEEPMIENYKVIYKEGKIVVFDRNRNSSDEAITTGVLEETGNISWNKHPKLSDIYDETGLKENYLHIGDFIKYPVYYDNVSYSENSIAPYTGWRVLKVEGDEATICTAGCPLVYYYSSKISLEHTLKNFTVNFFEPTKNDSYWTKSKFYTDESKTKYLDLNNVKFWDNLKGAFNNKYTKKYEEGIITYTNDAPSGQDAYVTVSNEITSLTPQVRVMSYTDIEQIEETNDLRMLNETYWLSSAPWRTSMWFVGQTGKCSHWYDMGVGVRLIVHLNSDIGYELEKTEENGVNVWNIY